MHRSTELWWVITAENRITGAREVISLPMELHDATAKCKELIRANMMDDYWVYSSVRVQEYKPKQLTLWQI